MSSTNFKAQLAQLKKEVLLTQSFWLAPSDVTIISKEDLSDEDLAWSAYYLRHFMNESLLYTVYYNLVRRFPKLILEIEHPAFFSSYLINPEASSILDGLLSDYEEENDFDEATEIYKIGVEEYSEVFKELARS